MTKDKLKIDQWYTIGGGDSFLKCVGLYGNMALFLSMSQVHRTITSELMPYDAIEDYGDDMYELEEDVCTYLDYDLNEAAIPPRYNSWEDSAKF